MILLSGQTVTPNPASTVEDLQLSVKAIAFAALIESGGHVLADSDGKVFSLPSDRDFHSAYTAQEIDGFIQEVLG
jgi:hypothetical protein